MKVSLTDISEFPEWSEEQQNQWLIDNKDRIIETCNAYFNMDLGCCLVHSILTENRGGYRSATERNRLAVQELEWMCKIYVTENDLKGIK